MTFAQLQKILEAIAMNPDVKPDTPVYIEDYRTGYPVHVSGVRVSNDPIHLEKDEFSVFIHH